MGSSPITRTIEASILSKLFCFCKNNPDPNNQQNQNYAQAPNYAQQPNPAPIAPRSIAVAIILSFVTCGIYTFYWIFKLNDELTVLSEGKNATNGAMVVLLSILTCSVYMWYWLYKQGEKVEQIKMHRGQAPSSAPVIYLILGILGLGIVSLALMQDEVNKAIA